MKHYKESGKIGIYGKRLENGERAPSESTKDYFMTY